MAAKFTRTVALTLSRMEERATPAVLDNGVLYITGTPFDDTVTVKNVTVNDVNMLEVNQNGSVENYTRADVHLVKFWGLDGDDSFEYHGGKDVIANGGNGHDTLVTGGGNDKLYGGNGNDVLKAGAGNDVLWGGKGNDWLAGGDGNDRLEGEQGNDVLLGGDGNDKLNGGAGKDIAFGGSGNDQFWGFKNDKGGPADPVVTPDGTADRFGIQDFSSVPGDKDRIWS